MTQFLSKRLRNRRLLSWNSGNDPVQILSGLQNSGACAVTICRKRRQGRGKIAHLKMKRIAHLVGFAVLMALATAPAFGASSASVSGLIRDSAGVPQIGAQVELLRPDFTVVASVYTDGEGHFLISSLLPGRYALKAMGPSFLPALRENIRVRGATVVNLTLNTLYEVIQWLPAQPRAGDAQQDDWAWTLRSAANRPLLRWLEDGPLVVVSHGRGTSKLKARLMASGQTGTFGESGERITAIVEDTPAESRELLARVDFDPGSDAGMESMLGFRQDLGFAGSVQSVAAVAIQPEIQSAGGEGLSEAAVHSSEIMHFGDAIDAEVGSTAVIGRFAGPSASTATAALPFATIAWRHSSYTVSYRMTTMARDRTSDESEAAAFLPTLVERNGDLAMEHGMHQEIGWERRTDTSSVAVMLYAGHIDNPVIEALGRFPAGDSAAAGAILFDPASDLFRAAGPDFSSAGVQARIEHSLPGDYRVSLSYASGSALVMPGVAQAAGLTQVLASARPRHAQTYAISFSGTLEGTNTHWRASYSWQPDDNLTEVNPYAMDAAPFFNFQFRQPIHLTHDGSGRLEALLDVRNLLAEGYHPYILSDGSLLLFAEDQRSLRAGLAFTF